MQITQTEALMHLEKWHRDETPVALLQLPGLNVESRLFTRCAIASISKQLVLEGLQDKETFNASIFLTEVQGWYYIEMGQLPEMPAHFHEILEKERPAVSMQFSNGSLLILVALVPIE